MVTEPTRSANPINTIKTKQFKMCLRINGTLETLVTGCFKKIIGTFLRQKLQFAHVYDDLGAKIVAFSLLEGFCSFAYIANPDLD